MKKKKRQTLLFKKHDHHAIKERVGRLYSKPCGCALPPWDACACSHLLSAKPGGTKC